jgi:2-(1,2-epoxy-1,2-dihydrophenyl)acetyl-CoA isomerase
MTARNSETFMEYECLDVEIRRGIGKVTLNRPDALNALTESLVADLFDVIPKLQESTSVRVLVITGAGRAFCAGGDLRMMGQALEAPPEDPRITERFQHSHDLLKMLYFMDKPVITAVNGAASGSGCNLALSGDIIIAAETAVFVQSFIQVGLVPDWGGMYVLPRLVGLRKAKELVFTGRELSAQEALQIGMINFVANHDEFEAVVEKYAAMLARAPAHAIALAKNTLNVSLDMGLGEVLEAEKAAQLKCLQTEDHKEAVKAFLRKRDVRRGER